MPRKTKAPPAIIRHVGRRIEATNLLAGWDPAREVRGAGIPVDVVTENSATERKVILVFTTPAVAGRVFARMLNDGAYGLDPYLPNDHEFRSAKLSGLAG